MVANPRLDNVEPASRTDAAPPLSSRPVRRWTSTLVALAATWLGVAAILWQSTASMVAVWWGSTAFNHGFLIVPAVLYLVWDRRDRLGAQAPHPAPVALLGVLGATLATFAASVAGVDIVAHFALVLALQSATVALVGWRVARATLFPLAFLYFAVPFGEFLVPPLQDFTATFTVVALRIVGIPVYSDGLFLTIPNGRFEVAEACAGVRFLIAMVALGALFANMFMTSWWRRALFFALACVVPVIANGFRAFGIVSIGYLSDMTVAVGADHLIYGWIFFAFVMVLVLGLGWAMREPLAGHATVTAEPVRPAPALAFAAVALGAVIIAGAGPAAAAWLVARDGPGSAIALGAVPVADAWRPVAPVEPAWRPTFAGADADVLAALESGPGHVEVYVGYYAWQRPGAELVAFGNRVYDDKVWKRAGGGAARVTIDGAPVEVAQTRLVTHGRNRLVWQWYWVAGRFTGDGRLAKVLNLVAILTGGERAAAVVAIAADYDESPAEAVATLERFIAELGPVGPWLQAAP